MNKKEARQQAIANTRTIGELKALVAKAKRDGISKVNPSFPKERVLQILSGALGDRQDDEVPSGLYCCKYTDRMKVSGDGILITNILRECA